MTSGKQNMVDTALDLRLQRPPTAKSKSRRPLGGASANPTPLDGLHHSQDVLEGRAGAIGRDEAWLPLEQMVFSNSMRREKERP
jgi:hypothetical protein